MFIKSQMPMGTGESLTVLDVDSDEFGAICALLRAQGIRHDTHHQPLDQDTVSVLFQQGAIPLIKRGKDSENVFQKYQIMDDYLSVFLFPTEDLLKLHGIAL